MYVEDVMKSTKIERTVTKSTQQNPSRVRSTTQQSQQLSKGNISERFFWQQNRQYNQSELELKGKVKPLRESTQGNWEKLIEKTETNKNYQSKQQAETIDNSKRVIQTDKQLTPKFSGIKVYKNLENINQAKLLEQHKEIGIQQKYKANLDKYYKQQHESEETNHKQSDKQMEQGQSKLRSISCQKKIEEFNSKIFVDEADSAYFKKQKKVCQPPIKPNEYETNKRSKAVVTNKSYVGLIGYQQKVQTEQLSKGPNISSERNLQKDNKYISQQETSSPLKEITNGSRTANNQQPNISNSNTSVTQNKTLQQKKEFLQGNQIWTDIRNNNLVALSRDEQLEKFKQKPPRRTQQKENEKFWDEKNKQENWLTELKKIEQKANPSPTKKSQVSGVSTKPNNENQIKHYNEQQKENLSMHMKSNQQFIDQYLQKIGCNSQKSNNQLSTSKQVYQQNIFKSQIVL